MKKLTTLIFSLIFAFCLSGCDSEASSVGIIGGADGPTVISVSSAISLPVVFVAVGITVAVVLVSLVVYKNKKKKR